jgi:hypothetical protein
LFFFCFGDLLKKYILYIALEKLSEEDSLKTHLEKCIRDISLGKTAVTNTALVVPRAGTREELQQIMDTCSHSDNFQEFSKFLGQLRAISFSISLQQSGIGVADLEGKVGEQEAGEGGCGFVVSRFC